MYVWLACLGPQLVGLNLTTVLHKYLGTQYQSCLLYLANKKQITRAYLPTTHYANNAVNHVHTYMYIFIFYLNQLLQNNAF
jgi:hypothetical protein